MGADVNSRIEGVYAGGIRVLETEGQPTGIFKTPSAGPQHLTFTGLVGDVQADRRVHGGPEKALHHYAAENYARLAEAYPDCAAALMPGSIGENISTHGWREDTICIGDIFRIGTALVQVSQPRSPCWKINHKFGVADMSRFVADHGLTGWYYRVIEEGYVGMGDEFALQERPAPQVTLARLWQANIAHRPTLAELAELMTTPGLTPGWVEKLGDRRDWLQRNPSTAA
jgi:MOSC domain-containing protein YiiM